MSIHSVLKNCLSVALHRHRDTHPHIDPTRHSLSDAFAMKHGNDSVSRTTVGKIRQIFNASFSIPKVPQERGVIVKSFNYREKDFPDPASIKGFRHLGEATDAIRALKAITRDPVKGNGCAALEQLRSDLDYRVYDAVRFWINTYKGYSGNTEHAHAADMVAKAKLWLGPDYEQVVRTLGYPESLPEPTTAASQSEMTLAELDAHVDELFCGINDEPAPTDEAATSNCDFDAMSLSELHAERERLARQLETLKSLRGLNPTQIDFIYNPNVDFGEDTSAAVQHHAAERATAHYREARAGLGI